MKQEIAPKKVDRAQVRAARALLNWTQPELATAAKVGLVTLKRFEFGHSQPIHSVKSSIIRALEDQGIEFVHDGKRAGVVLSVKKLPK
jgi:DNA-binding XRE family transcriptional regulator